MDGWAQLVGSTTRYSSTVQYSKAQYLFLFVHRPACVLFLFFMVDPPSFVKGLDASVLYRLEK